MTEKARAIMQLKKARAAMDKVEDDISVILPSCSYTVQRIQRDIECLIGSIVYYADDEYNNSDPDLSSITDED